MFLFFLFLSCLFETHFHFLLVFKIAPTSAFSAISSFPLFQLLENALRTYPASTPERWERIAEAVPGRTKKECMKRYKVCSVLQASVRILIFAQFLKEQLSILEDLCSTKLRQDTERGGLMVGALESGSSDPGSGPGRVDCLVFGLIMLCSWARHFYPHTTETSMAYF